MCRMFGYVGSSEKELDALYAALRTASGCDPYLKDLYSGCDGHPHGWGYVLRTPTQLYHHRTTAPIATDQHTLPRFTGEVQAIFHSRLTTGGVTGDPAFSHPYVASTNHSIFFFAHNGGLKNAATVVPNKVDSEWALDQIVAEGSLATVLPKLKENTESALNLLLMTVNRQRREADVSYVNWYHGHGDKKRDGYYQMYKATMAEGGKAVFSSTISDQLSYIAKGTNVPVDYGELQSIGPPP